MTHYKGSINNIPVEVEIFYYRGKFDPNTTSRWALRIKNDNLNLECFPRPYECLHLSKIDNRVHDYLIKLGFIKCSDQN